jgi:hypothetical protein
MDAPVSAGSEPKNSFTIRKFINKNSNANYNSSARVAKSYLVQLKSSNFVWLPV